MNEFEKKAREYGFMLCADGKHVALDFARFSFPSWEAACAWIDAEEERSYQKAYEMDRMADVQAELAYRNRIAYRNAV